MAPIRTLGDLGSICVGSLLATGSEMMNSAAGEPVQSTTLGLGSGIHPVFQAVLKVPFFERVPRECDLPTSFAQERLWGMQQLDNSGPQNHVGLAVRLSGEIDVAALRGSITAFVARHESMRTNFQVKKGVLIQVARAEAMFEFSQHALDGSEPLQQKMEQAKQIAAAQFQRVFDLEKDSLLRVTLVRLSAKDSLLALTLHSLIADRWSLGILIREVSASYGSVLMKRAFGSVEPWLQYADFAVWQRRWLQGEALRQELSYWRQQLKDVPPYLQLPWDHPRPVSERASGAALEFHLSTNLQDALKEVAREERVTLCMVLMAAFQTLLHRYSHQSDFVIGMPLAGRTYRQMETVIGPFENYVPLRAALQGNPTFRELLQRTRCAVLGAYSHQGFPFERIVEEFKSTAEPGRHPIFQVIFEWEDRPLPEWHLGAAAVTLVPLASLNPKFDLSLRMRWDDGGLKGEFLYRSDLFDRATIETFARRFRYLLKAVLSPTHRTTEIALLRLNDDEEEEVLHPQTVALPAADDPATGSSFA